MVLIIAVPSHSNYKLIHQVVEPWVHLPDAIDCSFPRSVLQTVVVERVPRAVLVGSEMADTSLWLLT